MRQKTACTPFRICPALVALILAPLLLACLGSGDDGDSSGSSGDSTRDGSRRRGDETDVATDEPPPEAPSYADNEAIIEYVGTVGALCPQVSSLTIPGTWYLLMIGQTGCSVSLPPSWTGASTEELGSTTFMAQSDASQTAGYFVFLGSLQGVDWTEITLGDLMVDELRSDHPDLEVVRAWTTDDPFGLSVKIRTILVKYDGRTTPSLGLVRVVHTGCSTLTNTCPLTSSAQWAPLADLSTYSCDLSQIDASVRCPSSGGSDCDEAECNTACQSAGHDHGYCSGNNCICG